MVCAGATVNEPFVLPKHRQEKLGRVQEQLGCAAAPRPQTAASPPLSGLGVGWVCVCDLK